MSTPSESQQPIPFRPSAASVGKLLVALIERKSGVVPLTGWGERDPFYLGNAISTICEEFGEAIDRAVNDSALSAYSSKELVKEKWRIAEYTLRSLEAEPETLHTVNTLRILAVERFKEERRQRQEQSDDTE
jgi:hypothetical protein